MANTKRDLFYPKIPLTCRPSIVFVKKARVDSGEKGII